MTAFRINDAEQDILRRSELSHPAKLLYLVGIRPHMDFRTAIVGKVRRISYQSLHEAIEYIPPAGSQRGKGDYSVKALRCLIDELERFGLVRRLPNDFRALFLECLVADREDAPKNRRGRGGAEGRGRGGADLDASAGADSGDFDTSSKGRPESPRRGTPPVSGKPFSVVNATATDCAVDNFADDAGLRFDEMVTWLKSAEKRRGKIVAASGVDPTIKSWVCRGVRADELEVAHAMAVADRERTRNEAPTHVKFVDIFLQRVLQERKPWFVTWTGIVEKGRERGIVQMPDEQNPSFKSRVFAALGVDEEEARKWQA